MKNNNQVAAEREHKHRNLYFPLSTRQNSLTPCQRLSQFIFVIQHMILLQSLPVVSIRAEERTENYSCRLKIFKEIKECFFFKSFFYYQI
jgi:hypothetical protein